MNKEHWSKLLPFIIILFTGRSIAQNSIYNPGTLWKKTVTREVILRVPENKKHSASKIPVRDSSLAEMMLAAINSGYIRAWSDMDLGLSSWLTKSDVNSLLGLNPDTVYGEGASGKRIRDIRHYELDFDSIYRYRILEEWAFNPSSGATDIHIKGMAPVRNAYGAEGDFRGKQAIFWIHFEDAGPILQRYRRKHPDDTLTGKIWSGYFSNGSKINGSTSMIKVGRQLDFTSAADSVIHQFKDLDADATILNLLGDAIIAGKIVMFDSAGLPLDKLRRFPLPDTLIVVDPTTGQEIQKIIRHDNVVATLNQIKVIEQWTFDRNRGDSHARITDIVPLASWGRYENGIVPVQDVCWLNWTDVKDIIVNYEQTHPTDNFATKVWSSYFYSDVKPTVIK